MSGNPNYFKHAHQFHQQQRKRKFETGEHFINITIFSQHINTETLYIRSIFVCNSNVTSQMYLFESQ